jgi:hypothetical protein
VDLIDDNERVKSIFDYVRDKIETRGFGGKYPHGEASDVINNGYGTVAEKNLLLMALLQSQGYGALPILIGTRGYAWFNPKVPHLRQFNRLLCYVPTGQKDYVLDAGSRSSAFPYLPPFDLVAGGVLINGENTQPVSLTHLDRPSGTTTMSKLLLHEDGSAICSTTVLVRGHDMYDYSDFLADSPTPQEIADRLLNRCQKDYSVLDAAFERDAGNDRLSFDLAVEVPKFAEFLAGNKIVCPFLIPLEENPFTSERRIFPVDFRYPFTKRCRLVVTLPDGATVGELPREIRHSIDGAGFTHVFQKGENTVDILSEYKINKAVFSCREYAGLKEMFEAITEASYDQFVVTSGDE